MEQGAANGVRIPQNSARNLLNTARPQTQQTARNFWFVQVSVPLSDPLIMRQRGEAKGTGHFAFMRRPCNIEDVTSWSYDTPHRDYIEDSLGAFYGLALRFLCAHTPNVKKKQSRHENGNKNFLTQNRV